MRSGLFLLDMNYNNKKGRAEPAFMMFQNGTYCTDGGGNHDKLDKSCAHTAAREFREESSNLLHICVDSLSKCPSYIHNFKRKDLCYYFASTDLSKVDLSLFKSNLAVIKNKNSPSGWKEKQAIKMFYLSDMQEMSVSSIFEIRDADNSDLFYISPRYSFLPNVLTNLIFKDVIPCLKISATLNHTDLPFLDGTKSFLIK